MKEEIVLTFFDLKQFVLCYYKMVLKTALFFTALFILFFITQPLKYKHESTLRVLNSKGSSQSKIEELLPQPNSGVGSEALLSFSQSKQMLSQVIQEMGLQIFSPVDSWIVRIGSQVKDRLLFEFGFPTSSNERFSFQHVLFSGEESLRLQLRFNNAGEYELWSQRKALVGKAKMGSPIQASWGELTLSHIPDKTKREVFYPLKLYPLQKTLKFWQRRLKTSFSKLTKTVMQMEVIHTDRYLGAELLNTSMSCCEKFVQREQDEIYKAQIHALKEQSDELVGSYHQSLFNHTEYLKNNIREGGFAEYAQEVETFSEPKNKYASRLRDLDLELERLGSNSPLLCNLKDKELPLNETSEFTGLDLPVVSELLIDYNKQKNALQSQLNELVFLKDQVKEPHFEITTIGSVFEDQVIRDLVLKASEIALQLRDTGNRNAREQERLMEEIVYQKSFLSQYLLQTIELKTLRVELLKEKVALLKKAFERLLKSEQVLLEHKLEDLKGSMQLLPQKWYQEALLTLKKEQVQSLLKGTEQLISSLHMEKSGARGGVKPLDKAMIPDEPDAVRLWAISLMTLIMSGIALYGFLFIKTLYQGFPVSAEMLKGLKASVSGSCCSTHLGLDTLHRLVDFISAHASPVVALIGGENPNYSADLAESLSQRGYRILLLLETRSTKSCPMESCGAYDKALFESSAFFTLSFKTLLSAFKEKYDYILLYSYAKPATAAGESLLQLADRAIIMVQQEKKQDLIPYFEWAEARSNRITFIYNRSQLLREI